MDHRTQGRTSRLPETFFAPAPRAGRDELDQAVAFASVNPIINAVMTNLGGLLVVLNPERQIIAINDALLTMMGIDSPAKALGLRPGEAIRCVHANDHPGGCGTSKSCATCGLAIMIMGALEGAGAGERECVLTALRAGEQVDLDFRVQSCAIPANGRDFILICLREISTEKRRAALERTFFHDVNNVITGLQGACYLLRTSESESESRETRRQIQKLSDRLAKEVAIQRAMLANNAEAYQPKPQPVHIDAVLKELRDTIGNSPVADGKILRVTPTNAGLTVNTDWSLLLRILTNMLANAFEATAPAGEVRLWADLDAESITFHVWNERIIPESIAGRIFQQYFTTKSGPGRGLGAYAMKLFGEKYLHGKVDFTSGEATGTEFRLRIPA